MKLTIGLSQINTVLGNVAANLEKHLTIAKEARSQGADLLVFPELSLSGYVLQDLVPTLAHRPTADDPVFRPLLAASQKIDLLAGFVEVDERRRFYIASAYLSRGEVVHVHRKVYLPTYSMFDEGRFFAWGDSVQAFDTRFGRVGTLICEDFWHASPPYLLWLDGADLFLHMSASPGRGLDASDRLQSAAWVDHLNAAYASLFTAFVAHANRVGYEDGLNFWGGSSLYGPTGDLLVEGPMHEEALTLGEIDLTQLHHTRARLPLLRDERPGLVARELDRILSSQHSNPGR